MFPGRFYCQDIRAYDILFGDITRPAQAEDLMKFPIPLLRSMSADSDQRQKSRPGAEEGRDAGFLCFP